ncbi:MAG: hypothetical protein LQ345_002017 [Seirophora villosa]|nr:MAG: hypothetical protein LQ345_002017 [Seirophora villosa]
MASIHERLPWHQGEDAMHRTLRVPDQENPTSPFLTPYAARFLQSSPLLALGTLDDTGRPWTTLLGGEAGFARPLAQSIIGIRTLVDPVHDPVIASLLGREHQDNSVDPSTKNRAVSALAIDLATRSRYKLAGKMVAGDLDHSAKDSDHGQYLNKKHVVPVLPEPGLASSTLPLPAEAIHLLAEADLFFITSTYNGSSMGTNHRGGPPGFVRVMQNDRSSTTLIYPEYSGNRLYQTLGNLWVAPKAGIVIPDFDNGDVLYLTCTTEIVIGNDAAALLPRSSLAVKVHLEEARFIKTGLAFRARQGEPSPYNPPVRFLGTERTGVESPTVTNQNVYARLISKELLAPSIGRFRFRVSAAVTGRLCEPGQYVALAFDEELGVGYSHMRDDDPWSLNDDLVRTFTVSSPTRGSLPQDEFEITIRSVGKVTRFLFHQNIRAGLEIPIKGFAGTFSIKQPDGDIVPFVAGGIGITPLLAHLPELDLKRTKLFWTINMRDIGLVVDTFNRYPQLASSTTLYVSGAADAAASGQKLQTNGAQVLRRRMEASDVQAKRGLSTTWYICTGSRLRQELLSWLSANKVVYEDFDY